MCLSLSLLNGMIRILKDVSHKFAPKSLFIGLKWNGYDWIHLSTGKPVKREVIPWCTGSPQGKSFRLSDSFCMKISNNTV